MAKRTAQHRSSNLPAATVARLKRQRQAIAEELPDLIARNNLRQEASDESTLSGEIRRAIHASSIPLSALARAVGITPIMLDEFLTGERTLRSDVLDRLAKSAGFHLKVS